LSSPDSPDNEEQQQAAEESAAEQAAAQATDQDASAEAPEPEPAAEPEEEEEQDELRQPLVEALKRELGDSVLGVEIGGGDIWVRVDRSAWRRAGEVCKSVLGMDYFCFLSGIDWMPNPDLSGEKLWDPNVDHENGESVSGDSSTTYESGAGGGDSRFQVFARVYNTSTHVGVTLKSDLDDADPRVDSWTAVYRGADWHERETWEMYGFEFPGHPGLRHIYLPAEFEGHPLRKDFPLLAREVKPWPGLVDKEPIPGEEEEAPAAEGEAG
jgi:NADH-quinone oxidoreductase subunit C